MTAKLPPTPAFEARAPFPNEAERALQILCSAFRLRADAARPIFYNDPFYDLAHKRVLVLPEAGAVACLTIVPSRIRIGGAVVSFGGIAGVATFPEHQRRGWAGLLIKETLRSLSGELGYPLSGLFTDLPEYYRRFGWEYASRSCVLTTPRAALPRFDAADQTRIVSSDEQGARREIEALHARSAATRGSGFFVRDPRRWEVIRRCLPGYKTALFEAHGGAAGYVIYEEADDLLRVHEMCVPETSWRDRDAERGLVGFLARRRPARVEWTASLPSLREFGLDHYTDTGDPPQVMVQSDMMVRVVDAAAALRAMHEANFAPALNRLGRSLTVVIEKDSIISENAAPVRLTPNGVETGTSGDADRIVLDIQTLGPLLMGYHDVETLRALGKLRASNSGALAAADSLFPSRDPFVSPPDRF